MLEATTVAKLRLIHKIMDLNDQEILQRIVKQCVDGERKAQKVFYQHFYGKMKALCYRYANNMEDAEDLLQDGFVKVFMNLKRYDFKGSLEGWIRRIMVNNAIDFYRKSKHMQFVDEEGDFILESNNVESADSIYSQFGVKNIMDAVQQLTPVYRMVFNMYVIEGFAHKDIAEKFGISEGTSKSNLAKAKRNLRNILTNLEKTL